jgi:flagellin
MRIQNNIMALNTHRSYTINNEAISKSAEKLSSGYRINRAGDDAAGLAISEKMRAQIRGLNMAVKNSYDANSLIQTAEGALQETHNILQRMRELAVQSASDTNQTLVDREALNMEFQQLIAEIDDTAAKTKFNNMGVIDGTYSSNIVTTNFDTSTVAFANVWASTSTLPKGVSQEAYTVTHDVVTIQATVTGTPGALVGGSTVIGGAFGINGMVVNSTAITLTLSSVEDGTLNGEWIFGLDASAGLYTATNSRTGEVKTAAVKAVVSGSNTINFGSLGTVAFSATGSGALNSVAASDVVNFTGRVTVKDAVTKVDQVLQDTLSINGETVKLQNGQNVVAFKNSGITINLKSSYVHSYVSGGTWTKGTSLQTLNGSVTVQTTAAKNLVIQTGANQGDELSISLDKMDAQTLGVKLANVGNRLDASVAISQVDKATNTVSTQRAALGALQNRIDHKIANLKVSVENLTAAESRIRDIDMASEMTTFTKNNILAQAATAMLAQANAAPQNVLSLLR